MGLRRRVTVSTSRAIAVPFATGITQPEICCPERVNELAREHQRGLYAHELAHLARHDPAWQLLYRLGEAVFSLQPLNRLVRRRLEEIAEHLTDERAVAGTGDRLGLARCLVVVAHWKSAAPIGLPATTFAAGPRLDRRVRRLLSGTTDHHVNGGWVAATAIALLIGSVSILPAIGATPAHAELNSPAVDESSSWTPAPEATEQNSEVSARKTWSTADDRPKEVLPHRPNLRLRRWTCRRRQTPYPHRWRRPRRKPHQYRRPPRFRRSHPSRGRRRHLHLLRQHQQLQPSRRRLPRLHHPVLRQNPPRRQPPNHPRPPSHRNSRKPSASQKGRRHVSVLGKVRSRGRRCGKNNARGPKPWRGSNASSHATRLNARAESLRKRRVNPG